MPDAPKGRLARLLQLGSTTTRVAGSYVKEQVRTALGAAPMGKAALDQLHVDNARELANVMSQLKGAAMKVGQQMASFADALDLPPEVGSALARLQSKAEPIPFDTIRQDVEAELGRPLSEAFAWFDKAALGTASLAQAHAAKLPDGRDVVVKVLHRGVAGSVDADLFALKALMLSNRATLRRTKEEVDTIFDEISERLHEELDYLQEAANLVAYADAFRDDPRVRIPRPVVGYCTDRVITMDRVVGLDLDTFLDVASPAAREAAARNLAQIYYEQVFRLRMLHADPHPGNYLFEPDGRVGLLDFGCVKRFDPFWIGTYGRIALAVLDGDKAKVLDGCVALGAWDGADPAAGEALYALILAISQGFRAGEVVLGDPNEQFMDAIKEAVPGLLRYPAITAPKDLIMLHRSLGGLYMMQRKLKVRQNYGALLREHATFAVAVADGRAHA